MRSAKLVLAVAVVVASMMGFVALSAASVHALPGDAGHVVISNCSDHVNCSQATCTSYAVPAHKCVSLANRSGIVPAKYATFACLSDPFLCTPTQAFWQDPTCTTPMETIWTPCGTCLQYPARRTKCVVMNDTFHAVVSTCADNTCGSCEPFEGAGLAAGECWPHPGVPGLYLRFPTLEACAALDVTGYDDESCSGPAVAKVVMPGQGKCYKGLTFDCQP